MSGGPRVSVIMSVHDGERYLRAAIDSILSQTMADLELIVVDDGSNDGSADILREYASRDPRVVVVTNAARLGLTRSLNAALTRAHGEFIARMDADDVSLPHRLERQLAFLALHPDVGVVGSFYSEIDEHGAVTTPVFRFPVEPVLVAWRMAFENPLPHPPILARRAVIEAAAGYDERWETSQDYDLFTRLAPLTKLANCPDVLFLWRRHAASVSGSRNDEQLTTALAIARSYLSRVLNRRVSPELVELLWRRAPCGAHEASLFVLTAIELCRRILRDSRWSREERTFLRRTASRRLFYVVTPYARHPRAWPALAAVARLSPSLLLESALRRSRRMFAAKPVSRQVV